MYHNNMLMLASVQVSMHSPNLYVALELRLASVQYSKAVQDGPVEVDLL